MRLASSFTSAPSNFTVDRSQSVQSITGGGFGFGGNSNGAIGGNTSSNSGSQQSGDDVTYTKKVSIPTGGIKLKLSTEPPKTDLEINGNSANQPAKNNQISNNSSGFSGVQQNYGVTNTQTDRLKDSGFEENFKSYSFGGVVFDSSIKK